MHSKNTAWTAGPWKAHGDDVRSEAAAGVCVAHASSGIIVTHNDSYGLNGKEVRANAHLIAAAPEIYGALDGLLCAVEMRKQRKTVQSWTEAAQAALAKARGEHGNS